MESVHSVTLKLTGYNSIFKTMCNVNNAMMEIRLLVDEDDGRATNKQQTT